MSKRKIFRELIDVDEAKGIFEEHANFSVLGSEEIELHQGLGRILSEDVFSPIDVPPWDRASMDGFAVIAQDTDGANENQPITLEVVGAIKAGYVYEGLIDDGQCVEIATGAPMPVGADSVVMVEYTDRKEDKVKIHKISTPGLNVMSAGTDIQLGERVLTGKTLLTSRELSVLAAMGFATISVIKKPKIGIFSSGDEIVSPGTELLPGKLYDVNSTSLLMGVTENGGDPHYLGIIPDTYETIKSELVQALPDFDMLIISGGTSAGMGDMLYTIIDELGSPGLLVHGVKVKPGKPTILAVCKRTAVIGLPGYPASALSIFRLFVVPYIRILAGMPILSAADTIEATVKQRIRSVIGRHEFKPMNLVKTRSGWLAFPVPGGSGAITSIALADGFMEIPTNASFVEANSKVIISLFSPQIIPVDIQLIGSHCIALAQALKVLSDSHPHISTRAIAIGSSGGVSAIRRGEAHIAGVHLLHSEKGYNVWDRDEINAQVIPGYYRMQGFIVKKGNPKNIQVLADLLKDDIKFMNRNHGSGTRILLDTMIKKAGTDISQIDGYERFVRSHTTAAEAVRSGLVDVAIGVEYVATDGLDFIPIREEEYDFLIHNDYIDLPEVQAFIKTLQSNEFEKIINGLVGYRLKK